MAKSKKQELVIYTNPTCPYCKQIKAELEKEEIKFIEKSTPDCLDEWNNIVELTNLPTVPTLVLDNNYFIPGRDFTNPQHLIGKIKDYKPVKVDNERKVLERLKTFNFQVSTAFNRIQSLLNNIDIKLSVLDKREEDEHKSTN